MKPQSFSNWADPIKYSGLLYFAQRMHELTYEYTMDSYKAPTTNAPLLVIECIKHLEKCQKNKIPVKSINIILDELECRLRNNIIVKSLLSIEVSQYHFGDRDNLKTVRSKLAVLSREIDPYVYALRTMEMIGPLATSRDKKDLNFLARELVTTLLGQGASVFHINKTVNETFFSNRKVNDASELDQFFRDIFPHGHNFTVCFKIRSGIDIIEENLLKIFNLEIREDTEGIFTIDDELPKKFTTLGRGQKFIVAKGVVAIDTHQAVQRANQVVSHVVNLFRLFNHKENFELDDYGFAEQTCCAGVVKPVPTHVNRMQLINDNKPRVAAGKLSKLMKNLQLIHEPDGHESDRDKFFRAIDFHGMSLGTDDVENQILNLWTSFETIVPQNLNKSNIANIVQRVNPFIGLQYFRRIFKCLTCDLLLWNRRLLSEAFSSLDFPENLDLVDKVFYLITTKECESQLKKLLTDLQNHELLKFRISQVHATFASPSKSLAFLKRHQQWVDWQICRIYRTRNSIVHSGESPNFAGMLVENAHDYFDQVFDLSCQLSSGPGGFVTFEECFDFVSLRYSEYVRELKLLESFDGTNIRRVLWRPRVVPTKRRLFPGEDEERF